MAHMEIVYATNNARVGHTLVVKGSHWWAEDPIVKSQPSLFSADPRYGLMSTLPADQIPEPPVEQATAAPGEKRSTRRG
jgi:hypothetical protein